MRFFVWVSCVAMAAMLLVSSSAQAGLLLPKLGCSWIVKSSPDAVNIAFPDESATYWGTMIAAVPGLSMTVRGVAPRARYWSFHAYDPGLRPIDALGDFEIQTDAAGRYTLRIVPTAPPARRAPNTLYTGAMRDGTPNPVSPVLMRVYVPQPGTGEAGGPLPDVSVSLGPLTIPFGQCDIFAKLPVLGANQAIRDLNWPDGVVVPSTEATPVPTWNKFFGMDRILYRNLPDNELTRLLPRSSGGFFSNVHNDYIGARISRQYGDVVVFRARMPRWPAEEVRYWSLCQNDWVTQRYVACVADHQAVLDGQGRATFVISDPEDRPATATREQGVNWLAWGGSYPQGHIIYRQMVASPAFTRSIASAAEGEPLRPHMGDTFPVIAYCAKQRFEAEGADGCLTGA